MIRVENLSVVYGNGVTALDQLSLSIERGQFLVLLGPSGAGKSTLLRCLNGLVRPNQGDVIRVDSGSLFKSERILRAHRQLTGMIFQQHHLIGRISVLGNVLMGRLARHQVWRTLLPLPRSDRLIALGSLDRVGLLDRALDRADQLSGGQQQRVGIARAMAQQPSLILADEPIASLDPTTAAHILTDLRRICREDGITAVVSLHQVDLARQFADQIVGISAGGIVFEGRPTQLKEGILRRIYGVGS
jgi:phosphonate transport system ATP-binding protein